MPAIPKLVRVLAPDQLIEFEKLLRERRHAADEMTAWLAARGVKVNPATVRKHAKRIGAAEPNPQRFTKVDKVLKPEDRDAFDALLADARKSTQDAVDWLKARGYPPIHYDTVMRHRARELEKLDDVRDSARFAEAAVALVRRHGTAVMSEAMLTKLEQVLMEQLVQLKRDEPANARDLSQLAKSVMSAVAGRGTMESIRREHEEAMRKAAAACEAAAKQGASGKDVVARMREIMGV